MDNNLNLEQAKQFINSIVMAVVDRDGKYTFVSDGWVKVIGIPAEHVISKYSWHILPDTHTKQVLKTGKPLVAKSVFSTNGSPLFTNYIPIYDENGAVNGCYLFASLIGMEDARDTAQEIIRLSNQVDYYKDELSKERGAKYRIDQIIGQSPLIKEMKNQIIAASRSSSTVLIEGETGTGKELVAHSVHALSSRRAGNFIRVNCSAIPIELMESEFFGYKGGSFTGANRGGKVGRFELANEGSIFFDEINALSPVIQPKFLRVLQEREIDPIGGGQSIPIDVRVIAASNAPLEQLVESGNFRQDLYYRLNVIKITIPPLRERKEDIPLIAEYLLKQLNCELSMMITGFDPTAMELLMQYDWPGNIRELRNSIESAMNKTGDFALQAADFDRLSERGFQKIKNRALISKSFNLKQSKESLEYDMICAALKHTGGNRSNAAKLLGISRPVLYEKIEKLGIASEEGKQRN
ncbi:sigma-54 interaction domain-containing protein [Aminipila butyrica]|uniref:sigma-54 interaction domain-containing protein n=1 Tax=Aminipila butyrica TaxID=433296 RepID=UPI001FE2EA95|nr:sigma 54-interacting transcriptional regulator [Aminipila butyrica]